MLLLPDRYLHVTCIPKYSETVFYGIFDTVDKDVYVFTKDGASIWNADEIIDSFESFLNPIDGFSYDLTKFL